MEDTRCSNSVSRLYYGMGVPETFDVAHPHPQGHGGRVRLTSVTVHLPLVSRSVPVRRSGPRVTTES